MSNIAVRLKESRLTHVGRWYNSLRLRRLSCVFPIFGISFHLHSPRISFSLLLIIFYYRLLLDIYIYKSHHLLGRRSVGFQPLTHYPHYLFGNIRIKWQIFNSLFIFTSEILHFHNDIFLSFEVCINISFNFLIFAFNASFSPFLI